MSQCNNLKKNSKLTLKCKSSSCIPSMHSQTDMKNVDLPADVSYTPLQPTSIIEDSKLLNHLSTKKATITNLDSQKWHPSGVTANVEALRRKSAPTIRGELELLSFSITQKKSYKLNLPLVSKLPFRKRQCSIPPPNDTLRDSQKQTTVPDSSSESNSLPSTIGSSTSPESLIDNILSAASSVSVQSSSSESTNGITSASSITILTQSKTNQDSKMHNSNKTLMLNSSPKLHISPPTPDGVTNETTVHRTDMVLSGLTSLHEICDAASLRSRSPSPLPSPSITIRVTPDTTVSFPEELKCGICMNVYTDPRTLSCLHSFCYQCLANENPKEESREASEDWNYSLHSSTPEFSLPAVDSCTTLDTVSPSRQRGASFSLRRKKPMDRTLLKSKIDGKNSECSSNTHINASYIHERRRIIICRSCEFSTEVPVGGLLQLPQNNMLVRKIEALRLKASDDVISRVWCSLCSEEISATFHCIACTLNLCTLCKEAHERQRNTASHRIRNIMELRRARTQNQQPMGIGENSKPAFKCNLHQGMVKSFCVSCLQLACPDCLVLFHKGHKQETIVKAFNQYSKLLRDTIEQTRPLCNYAEHSIERLNEISRGINRKCDEIQSHVETYMQRYFNAVEVHRRTLLNQVQRARESKIEMILGQQTDLEKRTQEALHAVHFSQDLCDIGGDIEILSFMSVLLKRFDYCQQFKPPVDPKISDSLHFLPKIRAPSTKDQNEIPLYGIITMQTVEPALCSLQWKGFSQLRLHKKVELLLLSRDGDGVPLCHGGLQINCMIKYKDSSSKFLPIEVSDNRDGTYGISFAPDAQGTLILTVTINEKPIKSSPFTFQARQVRPHTGIYHCCSFCSGKGNKTVKCSCDGQMPGYNGCGHGHPGHPGRRHWSCCSNVLENSECNVSNKLLNT